jgi:hypothetical protein
MSPSYDTRFRKEIFGQDLRIRVPIFDDRMEASRDDWDSFMPDTDEGN